MESMSDPERAMEPGAPQIHEGYPHNISKPIFYRQLRTLQRSLRFIANIAKYQKILDLFHLYLGYLMSFSISRINVLSPLSIFDISDDRDIML